MIIRKNSCYRNLKPMIFFIDEEAPEQITCWFCNRSVKKITDAIYYIHKCEASKHQPTVSYYIFSHSSSVNNKKYYIGMLDIIYADLRLIHLFLSKRTIFKELCEVDDNKFAWIQVAELSDDFTFSKNLDEIIQKMKVYSIYS